MQQEGRKSLRPRLAIAKVTGSDSSVNRCWPKKAKRSRPGADTIRLGTAGDRDSAWDLA